MPRLGKASRVLAVLALACIGLLVAAYLHLDEKTLTKAELRNESGTPLRVEVSGGGRRVVVERLEPGQIENVRIHPQSDDILRVRYHRESEPAARACPDGGYITGGLGARFVVVFLPRGGCHVLGVFD